MEQTQEHSSMIHGYIIQTVFSVFRRSYSFLQSIQFVTSNQITGEFIAHPIAFYMPHSCTIWYRVYSRVYHHWHKTENVILSLVGSHILEDICHISGCSCGVIYTRNNEFFILFFLTVSYLGLFFSTFLLLHVIPVQHPCANSPWQLCDGVADTVTVEGLLHLTDPWVLFCSSSLW